MILPRSSLEGHHAKTETDSAPDGSPEQSPLATAAVAALAARTAAEVRLGLKEIRSPPPRSGRSKLSRLTYRPGILTDVWAYSSTYVIAVGYFASSSTMTDRTGTGSARARHRVQVSITTESSRRFGAAARTTCMWSKRTESRTSTALIGARRWTTPPTTTSGTFGAAARTMVSLVGHSDLGWHYDGNAWSEQPAGVQPYTLTDVWGSGPADVFAVGDAGTIVHYDGESWSSMESGTEESLFAVWGSGPADVFAVGWAGTIVHYDGVDWTPQPVQSSGRLRSVWGSGGSDVYVVGDKSTILHYDGIDWEAEGSLLGEGFTDLYGVSGSGPGLVIAVGYAALYKVGAKWEAFPSSFFAVWGSSSEDVYAVGMNGNMIHFDGLAWRKQPTGLVFSTFFDVWGSGPYDVYVAGEMVLLLHYDGSSLRAR